MRDFLSPSGYRIPLISIHNGANDRGVPAILLHKSISFYFYPPSYHLYAVAALIYLDLTLTVGSIYFARSCPTFKTDLFYYFGNFLYLFNFRRLQHVPPSFEWLAEAVQKFFLGCLNIGLPTYKRFNTDTNSCGNISLSSISDTLW